jgi:NhaP-type Na+/H+ or K+/H+ antiporter
MIIYYVLTIYVIGLVVWNFIREKKNIQDLILYLLVLIPLLLRVMRIK